MELTLKLRYLLLALYEHKYNGKLYEIGDVFTSNGIKISQVESKEIAKTLEKDGLINTMSIKDTIYGQITMDGVEFLEDNNFFSGSSYLPQDRIKPIEREVLRNKLEELSAKLLESEIGKSIPAITLEREMEELKSMLNVLGKRSWIQILKGKVFELGVGKVSQNEITRLLQSFEEHPAVEGSQLSEYTI